MEETKRIMKVKFFTNFKMVADLEDAVNKFLKKTDIEIISVYPSSSLVSVVYYQKN